MAVNLVQIRQVAEKKEDENLRFRHFLKTRCDLEPDRIDQRVFETTQRVWAGIDCTACANCCRETKPTFSEEEVDRVARRVGMRRREFIETYLERSEAGSENPWRTPTPAHRRILAFWGPHFRVLLSFLISRWLSGWTRSTSTR